MKRKVVIALNAAWNIVNFRAGLVKALMASGYEVIAVAPRDEYASRILDLGCRYHPISMDSRGTHPVKDALLFVRLVRFLRLERPVCLLTYTPKPNIFGSIAANFTGTPVVNNVAGLGTAFLGSPNLRWLVSSLYRIAFHRSRHVFFQNQDDLEQFVHEGIVDSGRVSRLPGSGIDLSRFAPIPLPPTREVTKFLLVARLLKDKGIVEFVEAARRTQLLHSNVKFQLLGFACPDHPAGISLGVVNEWVEAGYIEYLGSTDDVRPSIADADCIVLPSYREGLPKSLLEAAAMARPVIATDVPGCRDVVEHEVTGYLCSPRDSEALAAQFGKFLGLSHLERVRMGERGRLKVQREFGENLVIERYLQVLTELAQMPGKR